MIIDKPADIQPLRQLWKQAFGDTDAFLDSFFTYGFSRDRCRQITIDGKVVAALYWFDCSSGDKRIAYLYAIATDKAFRRQGLCRILIEDTHRHLQTLGYQGAILVPAKENLFAFYEKLGYRTCCNVTEFNCNAAESVRLHPVTAEDYAVLRKDYLPAGSVVPEASMLNFLREQYFFYAGDKILLCAAAEADMLIAAELLGDISAAPGIVAAMGKKQGRFRTYGNEKPFAMYYPLTDDPDKPSYFALALD